MHADKQFLYIYIWQTSWNGGKAKLHDAKIWLDCEFSCGRFSVLQLPHPTSNTFDLNILSLWFCPASKLGRTVLLMPGNPCTLDSMILHAYYYLTSTHDRMAHVSKCRGWAPWFQDSPRREWTCPSHTTGPCCHCKYPTSKTPLDRQVDKSYEP